MNHKALLRPVGYILFSLCLTIIFTALNYPMENLTRTVNGWLSGVSGRTLSVEGVSLRFPFSMKLKNVALDMGGDSRILGNAVVSPRVLALLTGKRGFSGGLEGPWGASRFRVQTQGDGWVLDVGTLDLNLGVIPLAEELPVRLDGTVGAVLELEMRDTSNGLMNGQGQLTGRGMEARGGLLEPLGLSPLRFSSLTAFFTIRDNVLTLKENSLEGDLSASASGSIRLVPSRPINSRLDLILDLKPTPEAQARLSPLFTLMGARQRADGSVSLRIRGTIDRPSIIS